MLNPEVDAEQLKLSQTAPGNEKSIVTLENSLAISSLFEIHLPYKATMSPQKFYSLNDNISSVQSLSHVQLFATPWSTAHQAFLSITKICMWVFASVLFVTMWVSTIQLFLT